VTGELDLSLTPNEMEPYLRSQRTVRVATTGESGYPHVVPLWFVWHDRTLFLNSTLGNPTVENALRTGRAAAVVDDGDEYEVLRGVTLTGRVEPAEGDPRLPRVEREWSEKYLGGRELPYRRWQNRLWLRLVPERVASWDFRKIPEAKARRDRERRAEMT
jgi:nitroimidazol reductase NimA-like FMN-containing flavoprotein (pyridoxamine 5'-phosphate oxidase superfamily)